MLNHTKNLHPSSAQFHYLFVILKDLPSFHASFLASDAPRAVALASLVLPRAWWAHLKDSCSATLFRKRYFGCRAMLFLREREREHCVTSQRTATMFLLWSVLSRFMFHIFFPHSVSNWISSLSNEVIYSFQRAAEIGVELKESWLVCNSAVYLWNYATHMLSQGRHKEVIPIFSPVLEAVKLTGHAGWECFHEAIDCSETGSTYLGKGS